MKNGKENSIHESAQIYQNTNILNSKIEEKCSIGDFSKVEQSFLNDHVRIDRNNYIWKSHINRHSYTGKNTSIIASQIGKFVSISWNVTIGGANHDYERLTTHSFLYNSYDELKPEKYEGYNRFEKSCIVENDVWIGTNTVVLRGIKIGNGAVVGAGSIVTKDVPDYAIVAGNPAKIIKYRFAPQVIDKLLGLEWWNWGDEIIRKNYKYFEMEPTIECLNELEKKLREK